MLSTWKIAPALAAGCTVVHKPAEASPLTARLLVEIAEEAGLPAGVLNTVNGFGEEAGKALCEHPKIKAAARKLLAVSFFCQGLDAADGCFTRILKPGLRARLTELGESLADDFVKRSLNTALSNAVVATAAPACDRCPIPFRRT